MINWLRRLFHPDPTDYHIILPAIEVVWNHPTRTVFLMVGDPNTPDNAYSELEKHLKKQGYLLQILIPSASLPLIRDRSE